MNEKAIFNPKNAEIFKQFFAVLTQKRYPVNINILENAYS